MTSKEALKWHRMNYQGFIETMWDGKENNPFDDAFGLSLLALEKQIPKRVTGRNGEFTKEDYQGTRYTYYGCPNCKKAVKHHIEYCDKCGQHLLFPFVTHTPYVEGEKQEVILNWKDEND